MTVSALMASGIGYHFNSHAHVERDKSSDILYGCALNFNSHAHVERDFFFAQYIADNTISTHTLTWSVTSK